MYCQEGGCSCLGFHVCRRFAAFLLSLPWLQAPLKTHSEGATGPCTVGDSSRVADVRWCDGIRLQCTVGDARVVNVLRARTGAANARGRRRLANRGRREARSCSDAQRRARVVSAACSRATPTALCVGVVRNVVRPTSALSTATRGSADDTTRYGSTIKLLLLQ